MFRRISSALLMVSYITKSAFHTQIRVFDFSITYSTTTCFNYTVKQIWLSHFKIHFFITIIINISILKMNCLACDCCWFTFYLFILLRQGKRFLEIFCFVILFDLFSFKTLFSSLNLFLVSLSSSIVR